MASWGCMQPGVPQHFQAVTPTRASPDDGLPTGAQLLPRADRVQQPDRGVAEEVVLPEHVVAVEAEVQEEFPDGVAARHVEGESLSVESVSPSALMAIVSIDHVVCKCRLRYDLPPREGRLFVV